MERAAMDQQMILHFGLRAMILAACMFLEFETGAENPNAAEVRLLASLQWLHPDIVFAGDREGGQQVGEDEEIANLLAEVAELEGGSATFCMDVEADEGSESHGIHVGEVGEIEDDVLMDGHELGDRSVEEVGIPGE
jgi:hypothetical protein